MNPIHLLPLRGCLFRAAYPDRDPPNPSAGSADPALVTPARACRRAGLPADGMPPPDVGAVLSPAARNVGDWGKGRRRDDSRGEPSVANATRERVCRDVTRCPPKHGRPPPPASVLGPRRRRRRRRRPLGFAPPSNAPVRAIAGTRPTRPTALSDAFRPSSPGPVLCPASARFVRGRRHAAAAAAVASRSLCGVRRPHGTMYACPYQDPGRPSRNKCMRQHLVLGRDFYVPPRRLLL